MFSMDTPRDAPSAPPRAAPRQAACTVGLSRNQEDMSAQIRALAPLLAVSLLSGNC